jgi:hypothetical protein
LAIDFWKSLTGFFLAFKLAAGYNQKKRFSAAGRTLCAGCIKTFFFFL